MVQGTISSFEMNNYGYPRINVNSTWFGGDKKGQIPAVVGDFVEFEAYDKPGNNGKSYPSFKVQSLKKVATQPKAAAPAASNGNYVPPKNAKDDYWVQKDAKDAAKEPRISFFAAYERAVQFSDLAIRNGAFGALEKAKPTAKLDILRAFVIEQTFAIMEGAYTAQTPDDSGLVPTDAMVAAPVVEETKDSADEASKWS